jgi:hypothetical protein
MNKNILIILALIIVLSIGVLAWQFWPARKPSSEAEISRSQFHFLPSDDEEMDEIEEFIDWQNFSDYDFGFEVAYPDNWGTGKDFSQFAYMQKLVEFCPPSLFARNFDIDMDGCYRYHSGAPGAPSEIVSPIAIFICDANECQTETGIKEEYDRFYYSIYQQDYIPILEAVKLKHQFPGYDAQLQQEVWAELMLFDDAHKKIYDEMVLTFRFIADRVASWQTYRNEEHGFQFKYPEMWGPITLESQEDRIVHFSASNELIYGIWYHVLSGNIFSVEQGEFFDLPEGHYGESGYQGVVKMIFPGKSIKTIYADKRDDVIYFNPTRHITISPDGNYVSVSKRFSAFMINVEMGEIITGRVRLIEDGSEYTDGLLFDENDIYWSSDNQVLAIRSHVELYGGSGIDGLFVSDYGNPDMLSGVYINSMEKHLEGIHLGNVGFLNDKEIYFEVGDFRIGEEVRQYIYNAETKKLREK